MNKHSCVEIEVCVDVSSIQNVILSSMFTSPGVIGNKLCNLFRYIVSKSYQRLPGVCSNNVLAKCE